MRRSRSITSSLFDERTISIRRAREGDRVAVDRLAALDSSVAPRGTVLLAEVDGEPWAALSLEDGHFVADPFRRSASVVELLHARARQRGDLRVGRPILAPRWAA